MFESLYQPCNAIKISAYSNIVKTLHLINNIVYMFLKLYRNYFNCFKINIILKHTFDIFNFCIITTSDKIIIKIDHNYTSISFLITLIIKEDSLRK